MYDESILPILADIVNGYTRCKIGAKTAYVKHLNLRSELAASVAYKHYYGLYKERGVPTREERLSFLAEEGDWTEADEIYVSKNRKFLASLYKTKEKLVIKAQLTELEKTISEISEKLEKKITKRDYLIGATCEQHAEEKKQETQILKSVFADGALTIPFLSDEDYEYSKTKDLNEIFVAYFTVIKEFSEEVLKKIAVSGVFYNFFSLSPKGDSSRVFGDKLIELTFFQQKLLHYAQNVRCVYEGVPDIPEAIMDDYDALMDFSKRDRSGKGKSAKGGAYSMVGADKAEMNKSGIDTKGAISPFQMLKQSGKTSLSKKDFISAME